MRCSFESCEQEAMFSYVWAWGENGVCCERHRFILGQQSQRLARPVTVTPLDPGAPAPLRTDERIGFHARAMALQEELHEVQARSMKLHEGNEDLARQLRTMSAQKAVLESELQEHRERVGDLSNELVKSQQAAAAAGSELERLRVRLSHYEMPGTFPPLDPEPVP
jgi:septal ring factor EnvC (AmiA/AmiB activator)